LNTIGSIVVVGWTYRWLQGRVLYAWWKQSRLRTGGSFDDFLAGFGPAAPVRKPRWLVQERLRASLRQRGGLRVLRAPWHSLWLNFKIGVKGLFCTYLLTGWGCLLMYFGWEDGWRNSFHKGYEQAFVGPAVSVLGILLFTLSLFYVPMAQVHQAVTGEARAFFEFRFIWRLIQARITAYCGVAALIALAAVPLEILKIALFIPPAFGNDEALTDAEVLHYLRWYLFACCLFLFPVLLLVRCAAARVYRSAVLKVLRQGTVTRAELHPVLALWLDRLDLLPLPVAESAGLGRAVRAGGRAGYRWLLYVLLFVVWVLFVAAQAYVAEFFVRHRGPSVGEPVLRKKPANPADLVLHFGGIGFLNRELIQFPAFDYVPAALRDAAS
jgi:hypothetical protein